MTDKDPLSLLQEAMTEVGPRIMEVVGDCDLIVVATQADKDGRTKLFSVNSGLSKEQTLWALEMSIAQIRKEMSDD